MCIATSVPEKFNDFSGFTDFLSLQINIKQLIWGALWIRKCKLAPYLFICLFIYLFAPLQINEQIQVIKYIHIFSPKESITETSILGSKVTLQHASLLSNKSRTLILKQVNTPIQYDTLFSTFAYTQDVMIQRVES